MPHLAVKFGIPLIAMKRQGILAYDFLNPIAGNFRKGAVCKQDLSLGIGNENPFGGGLKRLG